jgi:putative transcriptional regulator
MSPSDRRQPAPEGHAIAVHLDRLLLERGMTLTELAERAGITIVNLSILKNGHARAIRFSTLTRLCEVLSCQPGDLITCLGTERAEMRSQASKDQKATKRGVSTES